MKNTLSIGQIRTMIFKQGDTWFGVALELNIVETGTDRQEVMFNLDEAVRGYVEAAGKFKTGAKFLNQSIAPEYEKLWKQSQLKSMPRSAPQIYSSGFMRLPSLGLA